MLEAVVVAADVAQGPGDVGDRCATGLAQRQGFIGTVRVSVDQQRQTALHVVFAVELGHAFQTYLRVQRFDLTVGAQQALPTVLIIVEQRQQVVHRVVDRIHERRAERQICRQQLTTAQRVVEGALLGFHVGDLAADQLQLGRQLLDALGERIAGALEFVLRGFHLRQLLELVAFFGAQGLGATEVFQRLLRVEHLLVQRFGLGLARGAVGGYSLLSLELLELFFQTLFLVAQRGTVGQCLQGWRLDVRDVDRQPRYFETLALETIKNKLNRFHPLAILVKGDAVFAQRQAEQRAVEQAHQALDVLLRELFAQAGVTVVVGVIELLLHRLQAFFQIAQTLFQILGAELTGLRQRTGQFVVSVLGREQLLLQDFDVIDQREAVLQHRQLAEPALDAGDFPFQAHQLLRAATLVVLQIVLLATVVLGLDGQFFLARIGVVRPGAEQRVEQWRQAMQFAAQHVTLFHAVGQGFDQRAGGDQRVVVLLHAAHIAEGFFTRGDVVDAAGTQAVLEGIEEQLLQLGRGDFAHVQQVDEQCAESLQALLAGGAQRDQGQVQRDRSMPANQQATQFIRLEFVGFQAFFLKVAEQFFLAQAGVVLLVMRQVELAGVGKELVTEATARAATDHADHVWAVGQVHFDEDVAGVGGEVETPGLFQAVLAETHVRHARQNRELQRVDRRGFTEVVRAVDRQRFFQRKQAEAVTGGVQKGKAAYAVAFLAHASVSCSSAMARARASSSLSSSKSLKSSGSSVCSSFSSLSSSISTGTGSGSTLCRLAARSRSC